MAEAVSGLAGSLQGSLTGMLGKGQQWLDNIFPPEKRNELTARLSKFLTEKPMLAVCIPSLKPPPLTPTVLHTLSPCPLRHPPRPFRPIDNNSHHLRPPSRHHNRPHRRPPLHRRLRRLRPRDSTPGAIFYDGRRNVCVVVGDWGVLFGQVV